MGNASVKPDNYYNDDDSNDDDDSNSYTSKNQFKLTLIKNLFSCISIQKQYTPEKHFVTILNQNLYLYEFNNIINNILVKKLDRNKHPSTYVSVLNKLELLGQNILYKMYVYNSIISSDIIYLIFNKKLDNNIDIADIDYTNNLVGVATILNIDNNIFKNNITIDTSYITNTNKKSYILPISEIIMTNSSIELDILVADKCGKYILSYLKTKYDNIFLKAVYTAFYFYIFNDFKPIYINKNEKPNSWVKLPSLYYDKKYYYYDNTCKNENQTQIQINCNTSSIISSFKTELQNNDKYISYVDNINLFEDSLINLVYFKNYPIIHGGNSKKIKYKSYYYKIRKDRYGLYIITKIDGRVSLNKVLSQSSSKSKRLSK
jgi:hypothetical protein